MILGLTGSYCAGKDAVADYLIKEKGFIHFSLSDELRKEMKLRNLEPTRENLINTGTELRTCEGNSVLAKRVLKNFVQNTSYVVTSIRHPDEIDELKKKSDFFLINIDAPAELRFKRMQKRQRPGDPKSFKEFLELEKKESQTKGSGQQLKKCSEKAEYTILNDTENIEDLYLKIETLLTNLSS